MDCEYQRDGRATHYATNDDGTLEVCVGCAESLQGEGFKIDPPLIDMESPGLAYALTRWVQTVAGGTMDGPWDKFNCVEIETWAELLRAVGRDDLATAIVDVHAEDDDEGDQHYPAAS